MRRLGFLRSPKIWLCTGIYRLQDAEIFTSRERQVGAGAGVSSTFLSAVAGVPLGVSLTSGTGLVQQNGIRQEGSYVWAARFRLLDVRYRRIERGAAPSMPISIPLLIDESAGMLRAVNTDLPNVFQVDLTDADEERVEDFDGTDAVDVGARDHGEDAYNDALGTAISMFEDESGAE